MLNILISNDDGVLAEGLHLLVDALKTIPNINIDVIAPEVNASGLSNAITLRTPLRTKQLDNKFWYINGTPTDCIKLGLSNFFDYTHDLVISGINHGPNLGDDVIYSGTVGAASEGRYLKHPPIAISSVGTDTNSLKQAAKVAANLVKNLIENPVTHQASSPYILNVNVPENLTNPDTPYLITQQGMRYFAPALPPTEDPRGTKVHWLGPSGKEQQIAPGTDFHAIKNNSVSITPLHINLTAYHKFDDLSNWLATQKTTTETTTQKANSEK